MTSIEVGATTHKWACTCRHKECEKLKDCFFCRRWKFFRCGGLVPPEPATMLGVMRRVLRVGEDDMSFYGERLPSGTLCFLVC